MRALVFSTNVSETEECSIILLKMYTGFHRKYLLLLLQILIKFEFFSTDFRKIFKYKI
jgi:hypothetical protein